MRILIIEDELPAAQRLESLVKQIEPTAIFVETLDSIEACLQFFNNPHDSPDLILLDIHLADGSCFEIFRYVDIQQPIIFTTAYDEYALQAFKTNAMDYLMKPIKKEELAAAIEKFKRHQIPKANVAPPQCPERFLLKSGLNYRVIEVKDIVYVMSEDKISYAVRADGRRFALDFTMDKLETMLESNVFFRVNRQFMVRIGAISEMMAHTKARVKLKLNPPVKDEVVVSSERAADFKKWLGD
jgi:two-component system, LytTR family, response regulator LytT